MIGPSGGPESLPELSPTEWSGQATLADILPAAARALAVTGDADGDGDGDGDEGAPHALALPPSRDVVVLLIDGLGSVLLDAHPDVAPTLTALRTAAPSTTLRAGFPATTATSLTSLGSGALCGAHGIIGYSFRPDTAGDGEPVLNALRWTLDNADGPSALTRHPPERIRGGAHALSALAATADVYFVMPGEFAGTGLTLAAFGAVGTHLAANRSDEIRDGIAIALERPAQRRLIYAYYPRLDGAGHVHGPGSPKWLTKLATVDALVAQILDDLPADATLLVTGDHGMITADRAVDIDTTAALRAGVSAVAGEARVRQVYAQPGAAAQVFDAWADRLGDDAHVATREQVIDEGWFGRVTSPAVAARIGDVVAVARGTTVLTRSRAEPSESGLFGHHGAFTAAEQLVPLLVGTGG